MKSKTTLTSLKEKEREVRKNLIIDAAEHVFSSKPFDKVSMRDIAREAGMATSSIYTYFPDQQSLFVEATLRDGNVLVDILTEKIEGKGPAPEVSDIITTFIDFLNDHDAYFRMMTHFMLHGNLTEESTSQINEMMRRILDLFDTALANSAHEKSRRRLSHYLFAALNGIIITFRKYPGRKEEEVLKHMKDIGKIVGDMISSYPPKKHVKKNNREV
ncbi:MAG TPA: TetR/AcrR family transcriptional regulator [Spirochaetota bacterium]|nr:TetR/AcrR family transcriptional regulator [Spirochaetota bacterium]